jgi:histidine triad (HIT) family protein
VCSSPVVCPTYTVATMTDCVFCRILAGELPGTFVYRDDDVAAFMDIQPVNPGHVLVVPVRHATYLADIDADAAGRLMAVAHRVVAALRASGMRCEGVNLFLADGEAAMQEVPHVHLHVFPRWRGDGFGLRFGPEYKHKPAREALEETATPIRAALGA